MQKRQRRQMSLTKVRGPYAVTLLIGHLWLFGIWQALWLRTDNKQAHVAMRLDLCAQNMNTISIVDAIGRVYVIT